MVAQDADLLSGPLLQAHFGGGPLKLVLGSGLAQIYSDLNLVGAQVLHLLRVAPDPDAQGGVDQAGLPAFRGRW